MATAITAKTGSATPAARKPKVAGQKLVPEETPTSGGKMRLPAPKNMEKSMREATITMPMGELVFEADWAGA